MGSNCLMSMGYILVEKKSGNWIEMVVAQHCECPRSKLFTLEWLIL